ncbi:MULTISPECIES: hypothetical protein [unclassified Bacillus (in: firmicutes)]|nr:MULTISPECIES: hypothetical protein [unclassified Bacillus (in: firmicutes)]SFB21805.1 hypothetical protein SAMN02799634_10922 [Bacillus sp. UNCCL13]SFQ91031.1 hypothetical protein SAMN04488577_4002 [Bacillus sp. cl95]
MFKENNPLLSDEVLDALAEEINQQYGSPTREQIVEPINND